MDTMHWMQLRAAFEAAVEEPEAQRAGFVATLVLAPEVREELTAMLEADARNLRASHGREPAARLQRLLRAIATVAGATDHVPDTTPRYVLGHARDDEQRREALPGLD